MGVSSCLLFWEPWSNKIMKLYYEDKAQATLKGSLCPLPAPPSLCRAQSSNSGELRSSRAKSKQELHVENKPLNIPWSRSGEEEGRKARETLCRVAKASPLGCVGNSGN